MATKRPPSIPLLESLADSRISILYLARKAKEAKNNALAKELTEKGQSLKIEMARTRRIVVADWSQKAGALLERSKTIQAELSKLAAEAEKSAKKIKLFTRALNAVSTLLALAKKVL